MIGFVETNHMELEVEIGYARVSTAVQGLSLQCRVCSDSIIAG